MLIMFLLLAFTFNFFVVEEWYILHLSFVMFQVFKYGMDTKLGYHFATRNRTLLCTSPVA